MIHWECLQPANDDEVFDVTILDTKNYGKATTFATTGNRKRIQDLDREFPDATITIHRFIARSA